MLRMAFRAQCRAIDKAIQWFQSQKSAVKEMMENGKIMTLSIFRWEKQLFLYYECIKEELDPHTIFNGVEEYLEVWPGEAKERRWVPMVDIFHYHAPVSTEHWRRKVPVEKRFARIARLKPEMIPSYIFYHYQLQEERPGTGDKYGIINLHENLMFFYMELPACKEKAPYKGKLDTTNTPDQWSKVMDPHFIKWQDTSEGQEIWQPIELVMDV